MFKLIPIEGTELSVYVIQLLQKHDITTVREFLETDINKIMKIINLPERKVSEMFKKLRQIHGPKRWQLTDYYEKWRQSWTAYYTGIESLDEMLAGEIFASGSVWEVCGLPGIGKSQLCHSMAVNFTLAHTGMVLYVDTKVDFSGRRIRQMLRSRGLDKRNNAHVMKHIFVERTLYAEGVIHILKHLLERLEADDETACAIKFVIIDALPAVWLQFCGDDHSQGQYLLAKLANLVHKLATEHFVTFLTVNLLLTVEDTTESDFQNVMEVEDEEDCPEEQPIVVCSNSEPATRLALGRYWSSVPKVRLSMEMREGASLCDAARVIKVLKSCYSRTGDHCCVSITDAGVGVV